MCRQVGEPLAGFLVPMTTLGYEPGHVGPIPMLDPRIITPPPHPQYLSGRGGALRAHRGSFVRRQESETG